MASKGSEIGTLRHVHDHKRLFLEAYETLGTITHSAEAAGVKSTHTIYGWLSVDREFSQAFERSKLAFVNHLERLAFERISTPVGNRGSDALLSHMLNAHAPDKYRDRPQQNDDTQKQIADALMALAKQDRRQIAEASTAKVIDEQGKEVKGEASG